MSSRDTPRRRAYSDENGWTDEHRTFRDWLTTELRLAGCEIRTLSPEGMAQVTVEHMVRQGWAVRRTEIGLPNVKES